MQDANNSVPTKLVPSLAAFIANSFVESTQLMGGVDADDRSEAMRIYAADVEKDPKSYVITPTIVISHYVGQVALVGGHNLDRTATRLEATSSVPRGHVAVTEVGGEDVLQLNPDDVDRAGALSRVYAKGLVANTDRSKLQAELDKVLTEKLPARSLQAAMEFDRPTEMARGLVISKQSAGAETRDVRIRDSRGRS